MNIISASSPRCLLESPAKILLSLCNARTRVERAPPSAAFDFDLDPAAQLNRFLALVLTLTLVRILIPLFSHCSDHPGCVCCRTDTAIRPRRCPETRKARTGGSTP